MSTYANGSGIIALSVVLPVLGILSVGARFYIRKAYRQGFGLDDWLILPALACSIGYGIAMIIGVEAQAVGIAAGATAPDEINTETIILQEVEFAVLLLNIVGIGFAKLSLLFFYRRVFSTHSSRGFDITSYILAAVITLWSIIFFFTYIFQCTANVAIQWSTEVDQANYCVNQEAFNMTMVTSDLLLDLFLFVLPIPLIFRMDLSLTRRLAIVLLFSIGALTVVASAIRLAIFGTIYQGIANNFTGTDEFLIASEYLFWTEFETCLAVITVCLPILQVWVRNVSPDAVANNARGNFAIDSKYSEHEMTPQAQHGSTTTNSVDVAGDETQAGHSLHP